MTSDLYPATEHLAIALTRQPRQLQEVNPQLTLPRSSKEVNELEAKLKTHDKAIVSILSAIRELMNPPKTKHHAIGFPAEL